MPHAELMLSLLAVVMNDPHVQALLALAELAGLALDLRSIRERPTQGHSEPSRRAYIRDGHGFPPGTSTRGGNEA